MKFFIGLFFFCSQALCCLHFPLNYKDQITEGKKEALIFHDGSFAHLIIRTHLTAAKFPDEVTWVLPFPILPARYEEVSEKIFSELYDSTPEEIESKGRGATLGLGSLKVHETLSIGSYQIQPIEILSDKNESASEFNAWLVQNKFNAMPYENQKYYLKKGAVFLAIRLKTKGLENLQIKPLHVTYKSDKAVLPLKFSHDTRRFDLDLYVFSKTDLSKSPLFKKFYLNLKGSGPYKPQSAHPELAKVLGKQQGFLARFSGNDLNSPDKSLKNLEEDPGLFQ